VTIGGWRTDLGKINNTLISGEDHEIFMRLRRYGRYSGFYDPRVSVRHFVPPGRLTREYFRRWFFWHGKTQAMMLDDLYPGLDLSRVSADRRGAAVFSTGRASSSSGVGCARPAGPIRCATLIEELRALQHVGLLYECWKRRKIGRTPAQLSH
jgi:hypothetical protein